MFKAQNLNLKCSNTKKVCRRGETFSATFTKLWCDIKETKGQGKFENPKLTKDMYI
jgi:hypothetical protein